MSRFIPVFYIIMTVLFASISSAALADYKMKDSKQGVYKLLYNDVTEAIGAALAEEGISNEVHAVLTNNRRKVIYRHKSPITAEIGTLEYDDEAKTFSASLSIIDGNEVVTALPLKGKYEPMIEIPVLKSRHYKDDLITRESLTFKSLPESKIRKDVIFNPADIIGLTPKRVITEGRPLRKNELQRPDLIKKGDVVHMRFSSGALEISALGEALEDGSKGERIRFKNKDSGVAVYAKVISSQEAIVRDPLMQLSYNIRKIK